MSNYESLLERGRKGLPEKENEKERFKFPKFKSFTQGPKTIIKNFLEVARKLHRDPKHLMKFVLAETGTSGNLSGHRLILKGRKNKRILDSKLKDYIKKFVLCKECGKPDTEIKEEGGVPQIKCKACSAKYTVREV
ncbi:MAG: translation initiation factor IF-2 subunit beta [Candidatus Undinarchaeales archaeon]